MFSFTHKNLLKWYKIDGRHDLPWRNTKNIYHIYLSEIMLQQTQVKRVMKEYYPQFIKKFPTLSTLADAKQEEVLSAWSGLGYYSRARNLHKTAKLTQDTLPNSLEALKKLPGIGEYTASAICSFAYEQSVPVVDTNIARVLKRYFALSMPTNRDIWTKAALLLNTKEPRAHNLALMDLGSLVCLAKNPNCTACPLKDGCQGRKEPESYTQTIKKEYIQMELFLAVCIKERKLALEISKEKMYKDMLVLPSIEPIEEDFLGAFKHSYTKYRLDVKLYKIEELPRETEWVSLENFDSLPISSLTKKAKKFF